MPEKVEIPQFELVGPKCQEPGCDGVLVVTMDAKFKNIWRQCHKCHKKVSFTIKTSESSNE